MNELAKKVICALIDGKLVVHQPSDCTVIIPVGGIFAALMDNKDGYSKGLYLLDIIKMADQFIVYDCMPNAELTGVAKRSPS
ncbi:MAG: hypothetical protein M0R47_16935 [Methylobacter sp.]|uniref:hypothetical protein n=1 Tax=Methylobacter sp. TaxID=2051955 RepID=UPI0025CD1071|nr:hypothetical protein [Methylobacter sp.]MCK9622209.1 hypothetical protein [Methylobacter sp.]